jgi:hypothetical protein
MRNQRNFKAAADTNMKRAVDFKETRHILSLATLFIAYLPLAALRSPSKVNGISSAKGTIFPARGRADTFIDLLDLRTSRDFCLWT